MSSKYIMYENRKWKITALAHVNGTYSGDAVDKFTGEKCTWIIRPNGKMPHKLPTWLPEYIRNIIVNAKQTDIYNGKDFMSEHQGAIPEMKVNNAEMH